MSRTILASNSTYIVAPRRILTLAAEIARRFRPEKIILFGSHAYGSPTADSDVDLLIVMPHHGPGHRLATRIRLALDVNFPMDLLVRSSAELRKGLQQRDWFIVEVLEKGITLHDHTNPAVGSEGRSRLRRRGHGRDGPRLHDEWVQKAEADFDAVLLLRRSP